MHLLEHLLKLNIESVRKPTFQNNYDIVRKKHEERIEQENNAPALKKWAKILLTIQEQVESVGNNTIQSSDSLEKIKQLISIKDLNLLPSFANEIRTQIAYSIRSLSISCWNKQSDIKTALSLIIIALEIHVNNEAQIQFKQDKTELLELEKKYNGVLVCHFCDKNPPDANSSISKTIYKETKRTYIPRRVQFSYSEITIPRCKGCAEIHSRGSTKYYYIFFALLILGAIIGAMTEGEHFIIGAIIGAAFGWGVGVSVEGNQASKSGIKDASDATLSRHSLLIDRIKEGWTFSEPTA